MGGVKCSPDTIVAPITVWGHSSVGIVRLSGDKSLKILGRIFTPKNKTSLQKLASHTIRYGHIYDGKTLVDEVLVFLMRQPKSYTREDTVEISSHGGPPIIRKILELCIKNGARLAEPGEFTKRAFLNGRIDLVQAEAVADLINAKSERAINISARQLKGGISDKIEKIRNEILHSVSSLNAMLDFPEDGIECNIAETKKMLSKTRGEVKKILEGFKTGRLYREGVKIVITGRTNVGKSSLINALSQTRRAIVTPVPGTTRDIIREPIIINGIPAELYDTAGLRKNARGIIEKMGMEKTLEAVKEADVIIFLFDASKKLDKTDLNIMKLLYDRRKNTLMVGNKTDLGKIPPSKRFGILTSYLSCLNGSGIASLKNKIANFLTRGIIVPEDGAILTNVRHADIIGNVLKNVSDAIPKIEESPSVGVWLIENSLAELDKLTGKTFREDMLNEIFSRFCIGK